MLKSSLCDYSDAYILVKGKITIIKDYNVMINRENLFDQPIKSNEVTYENIRKTATGQGDDYTTGSLVDDPCFKDGYKMISVDLSKQ